MAESTPEVDIDSVIERLLEGKLFHLMRPCADALRAVRGNRPGKQVQLAEQEIRYLCTKSREIFISQPVLLELEAPIKICGTSQSLGAWC